ncbi:MAG: DNA mismatch repair protein MutS [Anaeromyxobacteraceae bacterium]
MDTSRQAQGAPRDPRTELRTRLAARRATLAGLERADAALAWARLVAFAAGAAVAWAALARAALSPAWLLAPALAFLLLAIRHDRVLRARDRARRAIAFHEAALTRMDGGFPPGSNPGDRFLDPEHPYAADLDLFGPASLFALLCTARTGPGEARLAAWLLAPAGAAEVAARQRAAAALAPALDLREDLAVLGEDVRAGVEPAGLAAWGEAPPALPSWTGAAALALAAASVGTAAAWGWLDLGPIPFLVVLAALFALGRALQAPIATVLGGVERPSAELRVLALLLARLEREPFDEPRLAALAARLRPARAGAAGELPASLAISRLVALVLRLEWGRNQLFAPVAFALAWGPLHAAAIERWRARHGRALRAWMDAAGEIEALAALGGHRHEHPDHVLPELVAGGAPLLEGEALRHPLLGGAVANPVALGAAGAPRALLVSGSNMSGKSTYLRTVGTNVVLALAGAVVPAARLRLTPLQAGATLRIQDSLQAGRSRFYAEITRLKALADLARGPHPLLFLLDEILHGTNSHDRRVGAEALVRGLVERGAIGLVTTHDLALTELAAAPAGALANAHFEDQVVDGEIAFDYRLRPGVVGHSNAIALMRAVGLEV